ncbi:MAG: HNH endonuclease, partial [Actinomycetota bacterium]|nr:HNH endonuclease [Actinomycetota bacterium]
LGYGPIPAELARRLVSAAGPADTPPPTEAGTAAEAAEVWVRRLYAHPGSGALVVMESTRRCFPAGLRRFLMLRDRTCRTPWCNAPIRHADHVVPAENAGATSADNGQGLCQACNRAKQEPGWRAAAAAGGGGQGVTTTTPTGHTYTSRPPTSPAAARHSERARPPRNRSPTPHPAPPDPPAGMTPRHAPFQASVSGPNERSRWRCARGCESCRLTSAPRGQPWATGALSGGGSRRRR